LGTPVTIRHAVGIRNGVTVMPNDAADLRTINWLLDRIPLSSGGTAEMPGSWLTDRTALCSVPLPGSTTPSRRPLVGLKEIAQPGIDPASSKGMMLSTMAASTHLDDHQGGAPVPADQP